MGPEASPGRSEGQIVRSGGELGRMTALFAVLVTQLRTVVGPDQVAEVFKELDDGEGLLRRPICGNGERGLSGAIGSRVSSRAGLRRVRLTQLGVGAGTVLAV
jgi:hypothetical protein